MRERRLVLAAATLGLILNLAGVRWGLPSRFHPDEKADVVASMVSERRWLPDSYVNPSLPLQLTAPLVAAQGLVARGWPEPWSDPLLAARTLSAFATALAVLLLGLAASRAAAGSGALAALLLALAPGVVNLGCFATPEPFLLAATSLVLLLAVRHVEGRSPAWALGLAFGVALSTKYTAAALGAPVLAALWLRPRDGATARDRASWLLAGLAIAGIGAALAGPPGAALAAGLRLPDARLLHPESARAFVRGLAWAALAGGGTLLALAGLAAWAPRARWASALVRRELLVAGATALAAFVLGTPGSVLEPRAFLSDLAFNAQTRSEYKGLVGEASSFAAYLGLGADALTLPVLAAALGGLALATRRVLRGARLAALPALAAVAPYLLVASSGHRALRFLVPALPAAAWLAALLLSAVPPRHGRRWLTLAVVTRSALAALLVARLFHVDSRLRAERWLAANVPPGTRVDLITNHEGYAPRVPEGRPVRILRTLSREMAPAERFEQAARAYPAEAAPWLVLTAAFYQRFLDHPGQAPERARFFRELLDERSGFRIAARFRERGWRRPAAEFLDPEIVILRRTGLPPATSP